MNIYDQKVAEKELNNREFEELSQIHHMCPRRYGYYRRHYPMESRQWAMDAAKNWAENKMEQEERRKSHGTGAT